MLKNVLLDMRQSPSWKDEHSLHAAMFKHQDSKVVIVDDEDLEGGLLVLSEAPSWVSKSKPSLCLDFGVVSVAAQ